MCEKLQRVRGTICLECSATRLHRQGCLGEEPVRITVAGEQIGEVEHLFDRSVVAVRGVELEPFRWTLRLTC